MDNNVVNTINSLLEGHLDDYQIEKVNEVIRDFQDINEAAQTIAFSVCPKCGKLDPVITKAVEPTAAKESRCTDAIHAISVLSLIMAS